ncbi:hypothetical protein [Kitasatospora sp. NPDC001527]|uniref:hypothetical protein n=1 Tax=Kitasatospora sp. NPDC001527 TaxID=3154519 RepID=UPI003326C7B9
MNARERLEAMVRTDRGNMTVRSPQELREALDAYADEVRADAAGSPTVPADADGDTKRLAGLAAHGLRRALAAGGEAELPPAEELAALVAEFDRMRAVVAASWRQAAVQLAAVPHQPTALTGPYWYGQGWDDAVHHLHDMADGMEPHGR